MTSFEFLLVKIVQPKSTDIYAGAVYRHTNSNMKLFNLEFFNIIDYFKNKNIFLLGDFNIDLLTASLHHFLHNFMIMLLLALCCLFLLKPLGLV